MASLARDREVKSATYAGVGIPVYWIINLIDMQIQVRVDPSGPAEEPTYATMKTYRLPDAVPLTNADGLTIDIPVAQLLPGRTAP